MKGKFMTKLWFIIACVLFSTSTIAVEYSFIIPNPPGSSSDVVARAVADEYTRVTGNTLVFDYVPGADQMIAVAKFKNQSRVTVILGTTTMHVFNHVYKDNLQYSDADFDHIGWIGWTPHVWYVRSDSVLKTIEDVNARLRSQQIINIGVDGLSTEANVISLKKNHPAGSSAEIIKYKGSPQVLNDVLGGHIDLAIASMSAVIAGNAEENKIRILATTNDTPIRVNTTNVPAAQNILGVNQFNGGFLISVSPGYNTESQRLKEDLFKVINSAAVREKLAKINIEVSGRDANGTKRIIQEYREKLNKLK
jgi:tripartite-type tricarboxylate transporter receptor subunit TctC